MTRLAFSENLTSRETLTKTLSRMRPWDALEAEHIEDVRAWIESGARVYRLQKPDVPEKHLVSYFVVLDEGARKILLVDHKLAGLWLPAGGHVEEDEDPQETVRRECQEELAIEADFRWEDPFFLTVTATAGDIGRHTDVSLWYVLRGNSEDAYAFDAREFHTVRWFSLDALPESRTDPHLKRFAEKLRSSLS